MTEQRGKTKGQTADGAAGSVTIEPETTASLSRRALLKGATVAAPTILTLHGGAALAAASNMVTATTNPQPYMDHYIALDTTGQGGPAYSTDGAKAYAIPKGQLYVEASVLSGVTAPGQWKQKIKDARKFTASELCSGTASSYIPVTSDDEPLLVAGQPKIVNLPRCAYLSAVAFTSLDAAKRITTTFV
jgi:hypothetical protein